MTLTESTVEEAALTWFGELGYAVGHGPQMVPGEPAVERGSFGEVVLVGRLRKVLRRLNPMLPEAAREEALRICQATNNPPSFCIYPSSSSLRQIRFGIAAANSPFLTI